MVPLQTRGGRVPGDAILVTRGRAPVNALTCRHPSSRTSHPSATYSHCFRSAALRPQLEEATDDEDAIESYVDKIIEEQVRNLR